MNNAADIAAENSSAPAPSNAPAPCEESPFPRRICFLTRNPVFPVVGGVERITLNLAELFRAHGRECVFLSEKKSRDAEANARNDVFSFPSKFLCLSKCRRFFERFLREQSIDLVIFQNGGSRKLPFPSVLRAHGVPAISCSHGQPDYYRRAARSKACGFDSVEIPGAFAKLRLAWRNARQDRTHRHAFEFNTENSAAYVLLSKRYIPDFLAYFRDGTAPRCVLAGIGNFSATDDAGTPDFSQKKRELLFVGRLEFSHKRPDYLLRIWSQLEARFPAWTLRLVGNGKDETRLRALAGTLGLKHVAFEGFQKNPQEFYRRAAIFCMTSAHEGFPMVLVEAAAAGCVPVAFDSFAAVRDIIDDGENGAVVSAFDFDAYAETLAKLMSDDALRERLARNTPQICEKFSPEKIYARWLDLFRRCRAPATVPAESVPEKP